MLNMAKDLAFFSIVWGILTVAFGAAMHGALHGEVSCGPTRAGGSMPSESRQPMQQWSLWWLIRTYLQSLGEVSCLFNLSRFLNSLLKLPKVLARSFHFETVSSMF